MEKTKDSEFPEISSIDKLFGVDSKVVINLKIKQNVHEVITVSKYIKKWAHNYDFNENQVNGYRSLIKISSKFVHLLVNECERFGANKVNDTNLVNLSTVLLNCLKAAVKMKEGYNDKSDNDSDSSLVVVDHDVCEESEQGSLFKNDDTFIRETLFLMKNLRQSMSSLSSEFAYFWLDSRFSFCNKVMLLLMALYATPLKLWFSIIRDDCCRERAVQYAIDHQTMQFLTCFWSFPKQLFIEKIFANYVNLSSEVQTRTIFAPRQAKWRIDSISWEVVKQSLNDYGYVESSQSKARCFLISKGDYTKCESIVLHCRGGMADTLESHQPYLVDWVNKMQYFPVLSIDYTSLSEGSLSIALQEILDVYIWLVSNHFSVRRKLGFKPKNIVLCGHGFGGYLMTMLLFILNDIQELINKETVGDLRLSIQRPTAIMCISTQFVYKLIMSPSRLVCLLDPLRNIPSICTVSETVVKNIVTCVRQPKLNHKSVSLFERILHLFQELRVKGIFNKLSEVTQMWFNSLESLMLRFDKSPFKKCKNFWLNDDTREVQSKISDYVNASISPIFHRDFDALSDIPMYLITSEFDYTLDDNVTMAKYWKGCVTLKCFKGLPHSFLRYFYISEEARKASNVCLSYLLRSLGMESSKSEEEEAGFVYFLKLLFENMMYW